MPLFLYRLQCKGDFPNKGFGFSCMKMAYKYNITGTLFYESEDSVIIEITCDEESIDPFVKKCKQVEYITKIHILYNTKTDKKYKDFIMLNQINK